jgi:DNA polymerase
MMEELDLLYREQREFLTEQGMTEPMVTGDGNTSPRIVMVGEAPGAEEVKQLKPFVGKAGKNLDEFLEYTGLNREDLYITNVVKFRPYRIGVSGQRANRAPNQKETEWCKPFLYRELRLLSPKLIVTLGNTALKAIAGEKYTVGAVHGKVIRFHNGQIYPLYHPASIIYNPELKEVYLEDLRKLRRFIAEENL